MFLFGLGPPSGTPHYMESSCLVRLLSVVTISQTSLHRTTLTALVSILQNVPHLVFICFSHSWYLSVFHIALPPVKHEDGTEREMGSSHVPSAHARMYRGAYIVDLLEAIQNIKTDKHCTRDYCSLAQ